MRGRASSTRVSALQRETLVLAALVAAAERGEKCPTNWQLAEMVGCESMATGARLVANLEARGVIRVERPTRSARTVTIVASGKQTAPCDGSRQRRAPLVHSRPARPRSDSPRERGKSSNWGLLAPLSALPINRPCPVLARPARTADPRPPAPGRDPCHRCGTRGDLGCEHQAPCEASLAEVGS